MAGMLARRGAVVFDADELARRAVAPGTPGHTAVLERFRAALAPGGSAIDRGKLAELVFKDEQSRRELESIVHPEVFRLLLEELRPLSGTDRVVIFDAPLIVETGFHSKCDAVVVVSAPLELRVARVVSRGMDEESARARAAAQASQEGAERLADIIIRNDASMEDLETRVQRLWEDLQERARGQGGPRLLGEVRPE